ncbi:hypothetical protein C8Q76DRAFT_789699 [Earliella scabrosa]|nr:hypothetical protein C8Q76DRAFT_789699 [Earliella scabrosa]
MAPDTRRTLSLALTLAYWTPLPSLALSVQRHTTGQDGLLTPNIAGSRPRPITSASPTAASSPARPLTATETGIWWNTVADTQPATDRFPRFAYLLRHGTHQPESQSEEGYSRRSADPHSDSGRAHASLATNPGARAQCGLGDETALQSCVAASAPGTLGDLPPARRSSPSRNLSSARAAPVLAEPPTTKPVFEDQHRPDLEPRSVAMSSYSPPSTSSSKGGSRTEQLLASTRKGTDRSISQSKHQSQASTDYEDVDEDEQGQDTFSQTEGQTQGEGQPKKKKTRRAGVAITRVRRMQREVRRLAEEEEASTQRQQPTSLLLPVQTHPSPPLSPGPASAPPAPVRQFQGLPALSRGAASPPPRAFSSPAGSLTRPSDERLRRSEPTPQAMAAHSRGPGYDRTLENGDDVVLLRLPPIGRPAGHSISSGHNIWAIGPEERPRGGSA